MYFWASCGLFNTALQVQQLPMQTLTLTLCSMLAEGGVQVAAKPMLQPCLAFACPTILSYAIGPPGAATQAYQRQVHHLEDRSLHRRTKRCQNLPRASLCVLVKTACPAVYQVKKDPRCLAHEEA